MARTQNQVTAGILAPANAEKRAEILELLERAYWMEMETVMSYVANAAALDGIRAEEIAEALAEDVDAELGHARQFAGRIKELYGTPPGSQAFAAEQSYLQPPEDATDVVTVIRGVIEAEAGAIAHYNRIIEATDGVDWGTQDMVIEILRDEEGHLRQFERYLREFE
jgi:bacterioferritin